MRMRLIDADKIRWHKPLDSNGMLADDCVVNKTDINMMPTVKAVPVERVERWEKQVEGIIMTDEYIITILCKQLEDRCPPEKNCILSGYQGTCRDCWVEWCKEQYES